METGVVASVNGGKFGFITVDANGTDMFVVPSACQAFGGVIPPPGMPVRFSIVTDEKTGRPRAEQVEPAHAEVDSTFHSGVMSKSNGKFGFIQQESGEADMFVLPQNCESFGGILPFEGTPVVYEIATDEKTGRPRADNVQPAHLSAPAIIGQLAAPAMMQMMQASWMNIAQAASQAMVAQLSFPAFAFPPAHLASLQTNAYASTRTGSIAKLNGKFGFIQQDCGEPDMFVLPQGCAAFGGVIPAEGTRVTYEIVTDTKSGRPRAEGVEPEPAVAVQSKPQGAGHPAPRYAHARASGAVLKLNGAFGFIQQDSLEPDMFLMPTACAAFGNVLPPVGTRVTYDVVADEKTGKPRANDVKPEDIANVQTRPTVPASSGQAARELAATEVLMHSDRCTGAMLKVSGGFGFIKQDSGEADMFVMPACCIGFNSALPPLGTRLAYCIVIDAKTGRPRAEEVMPIDEPALRGELYGPAKAAARIERGRQY